MGNQVFAVGFSPEDPKTIGSRRHIFGGLVRTKKDTPSLDCAIDYGYEKPGIGSTPASLNGLANGVDITDLFLLPISEFSAKRFAGVVDAFDKLKRIGRFPFYFSRFLKKLPHPKGKDALRFPDVPDRQPTNCYEVFNLATRLSGIDLAVIDKAWYETGREHEAALVGRTHFEATAEGFEYDVETNIVMSRSAHGVYCEALENGRPSAGVCLSSAVKRVFGDIESLFEPLTPLECDPITAPTYLQAELDRLDQ